jgi:DNA-binding transcriptional ArsR family regulator
MGITKKKLFTSEQNLLSETFKILGHPARVAIIQYLLKNNSCLNTELVGKIGLSQPTISQHLTLLRNLGIITGVEEGNSFRYYIHPKKWMEIQKQISLFFSDFAVLDKNM